MNEKRHDRAIKFIELQIASISRALYPALNGCECAIQYALCQGDIDQGESIKLMQRACEAEETREAELSKIQAEHRDAAVRDLCRRTS